jgi:serine/threonine-protein kinase
MAGLRCGKYVLGERLAVGGMAEVFLATARGEFGFARRVVVKRLLPHLAERPEVVQLFLDEARLLARLHHPRVVQVLDLGSADGMSYQALEYLEGADLASLCARGPVPLELGLRLGVAVAEALSYVHGARSDAGEPLGIVHGDVAPGNVLVTRAGEVKLIDFGVARWNARPEAPRGGTPGFIAPEVEGGGAPTVQSDLFALGRLLSQLTADRRPPSLVLALQQALLAADPGGRPRTAAEVVTILNTALRELPARPLVQLVRPLMPERRRFPHTELGAATALLSAPARVLDSAVALTQQVVQAPAQLASFARRRVRNRLVLAATLSGLGVGGAAFCGGLYLGWRAPSALARAAEKVSEPRAPTPRLSDAPLRALRLNPPPPKRPRERRRSGN